MIVEKVSPEVIPFPCLFKLLLHCICFLQDHTQWTQIWHVDNASAAVSLSDLYDWFSLLCIQGPAYGYFLAPTKCFVVVNLMFCDAAEQVFGNLGVKVVTGQ